MAWSSRIPTSTSGLRKPPTHWHTTRIPSSRRCATGTVDLIARAQQSDGYLDTPYQIKSGVWADRPRFSLIQQSHEMYVMGHYIEAAVAYHQVTGNEPGP